MTLYFIGIAVLLASLAFMFWRKTEKPAPSKPTLTRRSETGAQVLQGRLINANGPQPAQPVAMPLVAPPALAAFQLMQQDWLDAEQKRWMIDRLRQVARPPATVQRMASQQFMSRATTRELTDLVMGNPVLAAKVLATVNSPFYGLRVPVIGMGQAITFLGFNTVRGIGLRYMLGDSIRTESPELNHIFDTLWAASALASELCLKLAQKLNLPDQGVLVTHLVLSFIGQLVTCSLMPADLAARTARLDLLERTRGEQAHLGLGSAEIGSLLLQEWKLPGSIIEDVRDIDRILLTPAQALAPQRGARLALCYLCARLGERLAFGTLNGLAALDLTDEQDLDFFYLQSHLREPALVRLPEFLRAPEVLASVAQMQASMPARR